MQYDIDKALQYFTDQLGDVLDCDELKMLIHECGNDNVAVALIYIAKPDEPIAMSSPGVETFGRQKVWSSQELVEQVARGMYHHPDDWPIELYVDVRPILIDEEVTMNNEGTTPTPTEKYYDDALPKHEHPTAGRPHTSHENAYQTLMNIVLDIHAQINRLTERIESTHGADAPSPISECPFSPAEQVSLVSFLRTDVVSVAEFHHKHMTQRIELINNMLFNAGGD